MDISWYIILTNTVYSHDPRRFKALVSKDEPVFYFVDIALKLCIYKDMKPVNPSTSHIHPQTPPVCLLPGGGFSSSVA